MPVTAGTATTLAAPLAKAATTARLAWDMAALCAQTATQHVVLTIYSAKYSEQVLVTGCQTINGVQHATVQRGFNGTTPRDWPLDSCACVASVMPACAGDDDENNCCPDPLAGVTAEGCIEIDRTNPAAPIIRLKSSGVSPVDTDCIKINSCGLVEYVSPGFPGDCLPVFSPCTPCDAPGGGATSAQQVAFSAPNTEFATGPSVYNALIQLDAALQAVIAGAAGIVGIAGGTGIAISGTSTLPTVSLAAIHTTPATIGGLTFDIYGRVTGYTPPAATVVPTHSATAPATVSLVSGNYVHGVNVATDSDFGVVKLANAAALAASGADPDDVITAATFSAALGGQLNDIVVGVGLALTGGGDLTASDQTIALDFASLPVITAQAAGSMIPVVDAGTDHSLQLREDFTRDVGGAYAAGEFVGATGVIAASRNVASVVRVAAGRYTVTLSSPGGLPTNYVVNAHAVGPALGAFHVSYDRLSPTVFDVRVHNSGNALADPPRVAFAAFSID